MELSTKGGWEVEPIGEIRSCFVEKFGIPRQPGLVSEARAQLILKDPYNRQEMVKELEQFSHLWVLFLFHDTVEEGWKPMVRPPGLGGQTRVGVFASRSPHRPNHIGLSVVKLVRIVIVDNRVILELGGGDFLNGTPVVDIKPYISYSDSIEESTGGYSGVINSDIAVQFSEEADRFCNNYQDETKRNLKVLIIQVLGQDPRPASQWSRKKVFGIRLWDVNIRWRAEGDTFVVVECQHETRG